MPSPSPRIAILGFAIECNRFSPVSTAADFAAKVDIRGEQILQQARSGPCRTTSDLPGFFEEMDRTGPWTPVPLRMILSQPGGPVDQPFFEGFLSDVDEGLKSAGPLDGVYVVSHGAALATGSDDPDGDLYALIRQRVGPAVPVIGTFDLHANVSRRMVDNIDVFVGYLENPHTDVRERGIEAACHMRELLAGEKTAVAMVKLPLTPPSITLLTASGPYGELIRYGQTRVGGEIMNVSLMAGFVFSDCPKNGYTAVVTARHGNRRAAFELALDLCRRTWAMRERFRKVMTPLPDAVKLALKAGANPAARPVLLADVADNPGGGGRGNTTWLLRALVEAGAQGVVLGVFNDAALAAEAHRLGTGARFQACFNRDEGDAFSLPFQAPAQVVALSDGAIVGRRGLLKGTAASMGPSALLRIDVPSPQPSPGGRGGEDMAAPGAKRGEDMAAPGAKGAEDMAAAGAKGGEDMAAAGAKGGEDMASPGRRGSEDMVSRSGSGSPDMLPLPLAGEGRGEGGIRVVVISNRQQCLDPVQLESLGVDIAAARTVVLKSRGHFRAGFDEFFRPEQIVEVDCPGLTSPALHTFQWTRLPRPVYPLDEGTTWTPPVA